MKNIDSEETNSEDHKMDFIESYLQGQNVCNDDELIKHYNKYKLNEIKTEFTKLGYDIPKGKKMDLIKELIQIKTK